MKKPSQPLSFKTSFSDYELIQTDDESWAIFSDFYKENSHSIAGAKSETLHNFINGCELENLFKELDRVNILEVGFGIGNGFATTFDYWKKQKEKPKTLVFETMEIDPELVEYALENGPYACRFKAFHHNDKWNWSLEENGSRIELSVITGDARKTINSLSSNHYHAIFQDAYSPGKNAELWTLEWFKKLYELACEDCRMTTYSASARIRKAMAEAKWQVFNMKGFKNKRSMTLCRKNISELDNSINKKIESNRAESLKDEDLC